MESAPTLVTDTKAAAAVSSAEAYPYKSSGIVSRQWRLFTASKPTTFFTKIHGKWYDLADFERLHPGGPVALGLSRGRDATVLFETHHQFVSRAAVDAILAKYEMSASDSAHLQTLEQQLGIPEHKFVWPSAFGEALKFEAREYFQGEARRRNVSLREATKATPAKWAEISILLSIFFATLPGFFRGDWRFLALMPLTGYFLATGIFHDGTHFALTTDWRINALIPYLFPLLSSPLTWYHMHNIGHHIYTNLSERDPDVHHLSWMKREHRDTKWQPMHYLQRMWVYTLLRWVTALQIGTATFIDLYMLLTSKYNDVVPMMRISGWRRIAHVFGRVLTAAFMNGWPFLVPLESPAKRWAFALVPYAIMSFLFMANTQIAHLHPHTTHIQDSDWYKHQVITTMDFCVGNRWMQVLNGGLNHQVLHHLFPTVNHCHLQQLQPIVARLCEKYDVSYAIATGYVEAFASHHEHSKSLSFKEE